MSNIKQVILKLIDRESAQTRLTFDVCQALPMDKKIALFQRDGQGKREIDNRYSSKISELIERAEWIENHSNIERITI